MEYSAEDNEMEIALRKLLQEIFPRVSISRSGIAMLAAEIDALEKRRAVMRRYVILDESPQSLN